MDTILTDLSLTDSIPDRIQITSEGWVSEDKKETSLDYSIWIDYDDGYVPALNLKSLKKIPSGVYKLIYYKEDCKVIPVNNSTDELFTFSESYTDTILKELKTFWDRESIYKQYKITHKRGLLLEGPPGNSKTATINLLIEQLIQQDGLVFVVHTIKDLNCLCENLSTVVRKIEPNRPVITIIEDVDKLIEAAGEDDSLLLDLLDGKYSIEHHVVILTSNNTTGLSEALLRPSRIDMRYVLEPPSEQIRREYFIKKGISEQDIDFYVKKTDGLSFAQLKEVFTGTVVLGKPIDKILDQINNPYESRDYLVSSNKVGI